MLVKVPGDLHVYQRFKNLCDNWEDKNGPIVLYSSRFICLGDRNDLGCFSFRRDLRYPQTRVK